MKLAKVLFLSQINIETERNLFIFLFYLNFLFIFLFLQQYKCQEDKCWNANGLEDSQQSLINVSSLYLDMNHLRKLVSLQIFTVHVIICTNCTKKQKPH